MDWSTYWTIILQVLVGVVVLVLAAAILTSAATELRKMWYRKAAEGAGEDGRGPLRGPNPDR